MQKYTEISENTSMEASRQQILDNDKTVASHYAGAAFPTENLVLGMECYRTDQRLKYRLTSLNPITWVSTSALGGTPTAPTPPATDAQRIANVEFVKTAIAALVGSSPAALDTLNELAAALGNDPNFATTMTKALAGKAPTSHTHTKAQVGLGNVDNTADAQKIVKVANSVATLGVKAAADLPGTYPVGISTHQIYNNGYPCAYGNVLTIKGSGTGATQLGLEWSSGDPPGMGNVWFRNARDNINKWSTWRPMAGGGIGAVATAATANTATTAENAKLLRPAALTGANVADIIQHQMADNDWFRIRTGGTGTNAGYVEIATADDGTEPIYFRQYSGVFSTIVRTLTLLDGGGNTILPGTLNAAADIMSANGRFESRGTTANLPQILFHIPNVVYSRLRMDTAGTIHVQNGGNDNYVNMKAANFIGHLSGSADSVGGMGLGGLVEQIRTADANLGNRLPKSGFYQQPAPTANYPCSGWTHLINCQHDNGANNYALQIAGGFYDQNLFYRKTNNNGGTGWKQVATVDGTISYANLINGTYTGSGGQQKPSYVPSGKVRFNMMNTPVNGDGSYKDWLMMDTYGGSDVPYTTMFGIGKAAGNVRAFIAKGPKGGSAWDTSAELITTLNIGNCTAGNANKLINKNWYWSEVL